MRAEANGVMQAGRALVDDGLPSPSAIHRLGLAFDLILLGGVRQHVPPFERGDNHGRDLDHGIGYHLCRSTHCCTGSNSVTACGR